MEQRDSVPLPRSESQQTPTGTNTYPSTTTTTTNATRNNRLAASLPVGIKSPSSQPDDDTVSSSEPTLRFPRPQGNKLLANWISASDPNIMDLASSVTSDAGLAGSTYELINKEDGSPSNHHLDSEFQDDSQFDESVSESVGSLDQCRQDDVQSLASTDHMDYDDENEQERSDDEDHDDAGDGGDDEGSRLTDLTVKAVTANSAAFNSAASDNQDDISDAESRSSIEYTSQSLGTPSVLTPEASKILSPGELSPKYLDERGQHELADWEDKLYSEDRLSVKICYALAGLGSRARNAVNGLVVPRPPPAEDKKACEAYRRQHRGMAELWAVYDCMRANKLRVIVGLLTYYLALTGVALMRSHTTPEAEINASQPAVIATTSTTTAPAADLTATSPMDHSRVAAVPGVGLIPLHESRGDEWLFGYTIPNVTFTPDGETGVLIDIKPSMPKTWQAHPVCLTINTTRGEKLVPADIQHTGQDNIRVTFNKSDAHGVLQIQLSSKCRPKLEKSVKVHFGKGSIENAIDCVIALAYTLTGQDTALEGEEVGRRIGLRHMSLSVENKLTSAKDKGFELVSSKFKSTSRMLGPLVHPLGKATGEMARCIFEAEMKVVKAVSDRTDMPFRELRYHGSKTAEKYLNSAEKLFASLSKATDSALKKASASQQAHRDILKQAIPEIDVNGVQQNLRFGLLDAQVSAKAWWLKVTGRQAKSEEYSRRAKEFIAELHAYSAQDATVLPPSRRSKKQTCKPAKGQGKGMRNPHQCVPAE